MRPGDGGDGGKEPELRQILRERGCPPHVVEGGAEGLIAAWRRFVEAVGRGYPMGLDDYRNDLDTRDLIAAAGLDGQVEAEDEQFRKALVATETRIWESDAPGAFWVLGYPRNATGELMADLQAEGLA